MENKKYSLLVIALYCYSGHAKAFVNHLMAKNPLIDLTLLTNKPELMSTLLDDKSVKIVPYNVSSVKCRFSRLRHWIIKYKQIRFFADFSIDKKYDIVNVHFPNKYMSYVYKYLRRMSKNVVVAPWGSDILRQDNDYLNHLAGLYKNVDYISTDKKSPLGKKIIDVFNIDPNKIVCSSFGTDIVDFALKDGNSLSQEDAKQRFGLNGRYVITCGYNGIKNHRHKEIIEAIEAVKDRLPDNLTLLFPMTYLKNDIYMEECKQKCKEYDIDAVFLTEYMSVEDVYKLRKATDMFVHVQTTDANSGTVKEYILCDKKIVHGSWIKYEELEVFQPLFYFPVEKLEDLGDVIVKAYCSDKIKISQGVLDNVISCGWDNRITKLNDFFMSIV